MKKVLVTGGAGYIGSVLVRMLIERGYGVRVLDRFFFGEGSLEEVKDKIEIAKGDIRDIKIDIMNGIDTVMDFAALSNDPSGELDPQKTLDINFLGRARIAQLAKKAGASRYILASSCSIYGFQEGMLDETSSVNPLTTYAEANYLAEEAILPLADEKFTVTVLRQATVFGVSQRMRFDLAVNGMVGACNHFGKFNILRDGSQWRPFVHVKDTSRAFITVMEAEKDVVNGEVFNVGSNKLNIQIFELAQKVAKSLNKPFEYDWYGDCDNRSYQVNFDKIHNVLGYDTLYTLEMGAAEIWEALENGSIKWEDPKTRTVNWYKTLLEWDGLLKGILRHGEVI